MNLLRKIRAFPDHPCVAQIDARADTYIEQARSVPAINRAMYGLSEAANHSVLWIALAWLPVAIAPRRCKAIKAARATAILGVESLILNQGVKRIFNRSRPEHHDPRPHRLRIPTTSSFPSGHATSAAAALTLLANRKNLAFLGPLALLVALSRAVVRIHHFSDIAAGWLFGLCFGALFRRMVRRETFIR